MYKHDEFGTYKRTARWIDAWRAEGGSIIAGWRVVCLLLAAEVRRLREHAVTMPNT